jgi:hypothetical protein
MPATLAGQVQINLRGEGVKAGGAYVGTLLGLMYGPLRIHGSPDMPRNDASALLRQDGGATAKLGQQHR